MRVEHGRHIGRLLAVVTTAAMVVSLGIGSATARPCADCDGPKIPDDPGVPDCGITATTDPSVSGTPKVGVQLTGNRGTWAGSPTGYSYQWFAGTAPVSGATSLTFTPTGAEQGKSLRLRVQATKPNCASKIEYSETTGAVALGSALLLKSTPLLGHGGGKVGTPMNVVGGGWTPAADTQAYQWLRDGQPISGATAISYTPVTADVGRTVAVRVTGKKAGYADGSTTLSGVSIQPADVPDPDPDPGTDPDPDPGTEPDPGTGPGTGSTPPVTTEPPATDPAATGVTALAASSEPRVSGKRRFGATLTVSAGAWTGSPSAIGYQWIRAGKAIKGATTAAYRTRRADVGKVLTVRVTASRPGAESAGVTVRAGRIGKAPLRWTSKRALKVRGVSAPGKKLRASLGKRALKRATRPGARTVRYQWLRDGKKIRGATAKAYRLRSADRGARIRLKVVLRKPGHRPVVVRTASVRVR